MLFSQTMFVEQWPENGSGIHCALRGEAVVLGTFGILATAIAHSA
ncbi:hypothetical protein [Pseudomonas cucumis]|nr:hypothetical protein [Pseudomonas cucumis]WLG88121.1 hypothetical protein PSH72_16170 [Pseudomonas cucumis]